MLLTKTVKMKWHPSNKEWYKSKGYFYTKLRDEFEVNVKDLPNGSNVKVEIKCDCEDCKNPYLKPTYWYAYKKYIHEDGKYYCNNCASKLYGGESIRLSALKKSGSISVTHPNYVRFFENKVDTNKYSFGSNKKVLFICPKCQTTKYMVINQFFTDGFSCPKCSDGFSYPNKFMYSLLEQLGINFTTEYSPKWIKPKRYDFYIPNLNIIIEMDGGFHVKDNNMSGQTKEKSKEIDDYKDMKAKENGIKIIRIKSEKSKFNFLKDYISNSEVSILFDLSNIDWLKCHEFACNSLVKVVCDLWNNGIKDTQLLSSKLKLNRCTIIKYLSNGSILGLCEYNAKEQMETHKYVSIICLNMKEIFNRLVDATNKYNINKANISKCCQGKHKSAGKHPITGEKLRWAYYKDWIKTPDGIKYLEEQNNTYLYQNELNKAI